MVHVPVVLLPISSTWNQEVHKVVLIKYIENVFMIREYDGQIYEGWRCGGCGVNVDDPTKEIIYKQKT